MSITITEGKYGNKFYSFLKSVRIQRSGHGKICDIAIGRLNVWLCPRTGRLIHWFMQS